MQADLERRTQLRSFLVDARSRLSPANARMPNSSHRRVPGLRRQEVAELIGVSDDWYRWYESGRDITVSPKFLSRLADVMQFNAFDRLTLYRLSLPELYRAEKIAANRLPASRSTNLSAIDLPSDIEAAQRAFDAAREEFLTSDSMGSTNVLRSRILASWERCRSSHVNAGVLQAPLAIASDDRLAEAREQNRDLIDAAKPIVSHLQTTLGDMGYAISITDRAGRVLQVDGDRGACRLVQIAGVVPGGDLSENGMGTNGIGTVITDGRPLQLMASEHFTQAGAPLTCTGAPIREPQDGAVGGVIVVMSHYKLVRPALLPLVIGCALEIEEELASTHALAADSENGGERRRAYA
jgi:transcriptional regulator with XRE-family HTH domain